MNELVEKISKIVVIFAGGTGTRFSNAGTPKQFLKIFGKPILFHTIDHFEHHSLINGIIIVCLESYIMQLQAMLGTAYHKIIGVIPGGATAMESQYMGLKMLSRDKGYSDDTIVLLHDGVRPMINEDTITRCIESTVKYGSAITVSPAVETVVCAPDGENISDFFDRSKCQLARAPQAFRLGELICLHEKAKVENHTESIDSASLMLYYGKTLHAIVGPAENLKITTTSDYYVCKALMEARENAQIFGLGVADGKA